ncbi:MAG: hypothetical protein M3R04_03210, partial [bacterium]|nr:hypothetical protein [bacterium]
RMLFSALQEKRANPTDAEIKKVWEDDKQTLIDQYASENHLPDSEKAKVTFEQVKELAKDRVVMNKSMAPEMQAEIMGDIVGNAKLEIVGIKDATKAKRIAQQIMEPHVKMVEAQKKQMEEMAKPPEAAAGGPPAAGDKPEGDGGAAEVDAPPAVDGEQTEEPKEGGE